ncbi:uncharacterized protein LOC133192116 [Saccostrea echinata]|uniref:uncharacterized protein LOC133192116 n=1 Tax=Saccostrea echinata TaxID=191078 RepID=UPI002A841D80|nr:uncharacterized protein LOC133192116 [Saccostrea echinata]
MKSKKKENAVVYENETTCMNTGPEADFEFFKRVLDTIPPASFFSEDTKEKLLQESDESESESDEVDGEDVKKRKKEQRSKGVKKQKLNPLQIKTVSQLQFESQSAEEEEPYSKIKEKNKHKHKGKSNKKSDGGEGTPDVSKAARLEALRQKMVEMRKLSKERKLTPTELQEKKRLRRKESKLKSKVKRKKNKNPVLKASGPVNGDVVTGYKSPERPSVMDKGGKLVFSKFDFTKNDEKEKHKNSLHGKDFKRLLENIEKRKSKVENMKEKDAEKAKKMEQKNAWQSVMLRAEGEKVKDDPALLKKALKKKEKMKERKKAKWTERQDAVNKKMEKRQEKRQKNIQSRKQSKKDKKIKLAKKKGRMVPGF